MRSTRWPWLIGLAAVAVLMYGAIILRIGGG